MINFLHYIQTVDSHTMGEPTRIVTGGAPRIIGKTMMEKKLYMVKELDWLRKTLMNEPRGHRDMFGAIITDPCSEECDLGVIFMDSKGYLNMCGHGVIGTVTTAINLGFIPYKPVVKLDTPTGVVECIVERNDNIVAKVTFTNVPSFTLYQDIKVEISEYGTIRLDVAFGGNIFAIVDATLFGLKLIPEEHQIITSLGMTILRAANEQLVVQHPWIPEINTIDLLEFSIPSTNDGVNYRNVVVFGNGQIDRSPCGTGTCAKMAVLHNKGKLKIGEYFVHQGIINSMFTGRILEEKVINQYRGIIPQITGSAWITGTHQFFIQDKDPYPQGFEII